MHVCVKLLSHVWLFATLWTVACQAPLSMENSPGQNKSMSGPYSSVSPLSVIVSVRLPWWLRWLRIWLQCGRPRFEPWVGKMSWRRERLPTPVFWPGEFHGLHSPWGCKESDTTERLSHSLLFSIMPTVLVIPVTEDKERDTFFFFRKRQSVPHSQTML